MASIAKLTALSVLIALFVHSAQGAVSADSSLDCDTTETVPGGEILCHIRVRDELQDPTDSASPSDFRASVVAETANAQPILSLVVATGDPSTMKFTVSCATGTKLKITAVLASSGQSIRHSGIDAVVLASPPTLLQNFRCEASELALRKSLLCRAEAFDSKGQPAVVESKDIFATEDHGDGQFKFVSGRRVLELRFSAPNFPSMAYPAFVLRVTLTSNPTASYNVSLAVVYPSLVPTARSTAQCDSALGITQCHVAANDATGPVLFNANQFDVTFQRLVDQQWVTTMAETALWTPSKTVKSNAQLRVEPVARNEVFQSRTHIKLRSSGEDIHGSPFTSTIGVPPTADSVSFYQCTRSFLSAGGRSTCFLGVSDEVTADPSFIEVKANKGDILSKRYKMGTKEDGASLDGRRLIAIEYMAPRSLHTRTEDSIEVTVQGKSVRRAPIELVVYPSTLGEDGEEALDHDEERSDHRLQVVLFGFFFFGGGMSVGVVYFVRHRRRLTAVLEKRKREALEDAKIEVRQLTDVERKAAQEAATASPPQRQTTDVLAARDDDDNDA